ncbi:SAF domain-containing protein [Aeromicrobium sp.]|uniref:SAF domain-containing protein n=1 Tax=Aeromicrobium sp. TaxID=1871063 RepID=UPI003D6BB465
MERISRFVLRHRRPLAALLAGLAVLLALGALRAEPPGHTVVVAAHDLASGTKLAAADVRRARLPEAVAPAHSTSRVDDVIGRTVAGPMRRGEVVTDRRVVRADRMSGFPSGTVLATVRLADADALASLRVGDRVDVVAVAPDGGERAEVVARGVEIVTLPSTDHESGGVPVGVATSEDEALRLAERALDARLSVLASRA